MGCLEDDETEDGGDDSVVVDDPRGCFELPDFGVVDDLPFFLLLAVFSRQALTC